VRIQFILNILLCIKKYYIFLLPLFYFSVVYFWDYITIANNSEAVYQVVGCKAEKIASKGSGYLYDVGGGEKLGFAVTFHTENTMTEPGPCAKITYIVTDSGTRMVLKLEDINDG